LTPAKYEKANSMLGLFENKHGLFHSQSFLKGIQSKIIKVDNGYLFAPRKPPQLLIVNDKVEHKMFGFVLIGRWIFDVRRTMPLLVDESYFKRNEVTACRQFIINKKSICFVKYNNCLEQNQVLLYNTLHEDFT
jgi:hypothetical protein